MEKVEIKTMPEQLKSLVIGNKIFRSAFDYELLPEDLERARVELNETEEVRETAIRELRKMMLRDGMKCRTDDAYILRFLRCKKFKCDEAYKMVRVFYSLRKDYPEIFSVLPSASSLMTCLDNNVITYLPFRDEDGSLILIQKFGSWNPVEQSVYELCQLVQPIGDIVNMNPCGQIHKIVDIVDCEGMSMSYLPAVLQPKALLFWTKAYQNMYPWRIKRVILVNCNKVVYRGLKAVRYLLQKKIADRIVVIGSDITELHHYVNPAILPKEYGGSLDDSGLKATTRHILDNLPYVEHNLSFFNA